MTNSYDVDHGLSQCPPGPLEPIELAPAKAPDIRVEVEPDPRGVSVGVWQGSHCIYSGAHPIPAPASPVSTVEQGDALALLDHPLLRDVLGYIEDAGPADVWSAAQAWMALRDAALSAAPAAGDALALLDHPLLRDVLGYIEDAGPADVWGAAQSWMSLRDTALAAQRKGDA